MKIHTVTRADTGELRFVRAHTRAGAERYVREQIKPAITAKVATQDELVRYLSAGGKIEDATGTAAIVGGELE